MYNISDLKLSKRQTGMNRKLEHYLEGYGQKGELSREGFSPPPRSRGGGPVGYGEENPGYDNNPRDMAPQQHRYARDWDKEVGDG